jgi:hypothetical protein
MERVEMKTRRITTVAAATAALSLMAGPALAHFCVNASKPPLAGAQIVFDEGDEVLHITNGLAKRLEKGLVDPETGAGFHGIIGFVDDDGNAGHTYIVTPDGEIPSVAQENGPACRGITNFRRLADCD